MENLKNIFGKNVIALDMGENIGYILNVAFDEKLKCLLGFIVCDSESEEEEFLALSDVKAISEEGVMIESAASLTLNFMNMPSPFGKIVLSSEGENLGAVIDVLASGKNVEKIITSKGEICPKNIEIVGKNYVIFTKNIKKRKNKVKLLQSVNLPKVEIMTDKISAARTPARVSVTPLMILNKTVTQDIFGFNNEIILKKGEKITQEKINKAKKHNKLNYLIFNSK